MRVILLCACFSFLSIGTLFSQDLEKLADEIDKLLNEKRTHQALTLVNKEIAKFPEEPVLYLYKAIVYENLRDFSEALNYIDTALAKSPYYDRFFYYKSLICLHKFDFEDALESIKEALVIAPYNKEYVELKSYILSLQGNNKAAYKELMKLNDLYPRDEWIHTALSIISLLDKDYVTSDRNLAIAYQLNPNSPLINNILGVSYYNKKEYIKALDHFSVSLEKNPHEPIYHLNRGMAYIMINQKSRIWEEIEEIIKIQQKPEYLNNLFHKRSLRINKTPLTKEAEESMFTELVRVWITLQKDVLTFMDQEYVHLLPVSQQRFLIMKAAVNVATYNVADAQKNVTDKLAQDPGHSEAIFYKSVVKFLLGSNKEACENIKSLPQYSHFLPVFCEQ